MLTSLLLGRRWSAYRLRGLLPSDLIRVGSFGRRSVPVKPGPAYHAVGSEKLTLLALGARYGCHHCGRRIDYHRQLDDRQAAAAEGGGAAGQQPLGFIADHIPPTALAVGERQLFFPQCPECCTLQATTVRMKRRTLRLQRWSRLTLSDCWLPVPLLLLPAAPAIQHLMGLS